MDYARVERFAAPVLAEREHVAGLAVAAPVRRRGETAAHRNLRVTVADRLLRRGVDIDTISWDAHRLEDGRWLSTYEYEMLELRAWPDEVKMFLVTYDGDLSRPVLHMDDIAALKFE